MVLTPAFLIGILVPYDFKIESFFNVILTLISLLIAASGKVFVNYFFTFGAIIGVDS